MYTRMALRVKPYFLPALWITMGGLTLFTAGERSRLGEESLDDGLDDSEWGDIGLANGEAPWWSESGQTTELCVIFPVRPGSYTPIFQGSFFLVNCFFCVVFILSFCFL